MRALEMSHSGTGVRHYLELLKASGVRELLLPKTETEKNLNETPVLESLPANLSKETPLGRNQKERLIRLSETVKTCVQCAELASARTQTVFGAGCARAKLVFVGEAPGFEEDRLGLPFVGRAGQLLTKMIESIGLTRREVFICNVLKCRPPGNRNPKEDEVHHCEPYLWEQLEIIAPRVVCALGNFAAQTLLKTRKPISQLRGVTHDVRGFQLVCTFHPAYLLRNPSDKGKAWEDLKRVRQLLMVPMQPLLEKNDAVPT